METAVPESPAPQSSLAPVESLTPVESPVPAVSPAPVESPGIAEDPWAIPPIPKAGDIPGNEATEPITGHLTLGPETHLATATISTAGGAFEAGGLHVEVPTAALTDDTTFEVTQAQITGSGFGDLVTPVTPLYLVDDGGAALGEPVTLTLPATIPDGAVAMASSYDDAAGVITPLIPIAQDATTLTVGATHFSGVFGGLLDLTKMPSTVDSGFRPGIDDWTFPNEGSYAAKGGHCEGQSLSAIWYYINQRRKDSAMPLHEVGDNNDAAAKTPDFWSDDSNAYRFVSIVHNGPVAVLKTYLFFRNMWNNTNDRMAYNAFWAAIALTGEPQLIRISSAPNTGGHTMIVYRVTPDRLYIADPNYPGRLRTIRYDTLTGKLGPYSSGDNATSIAAAGATNYIKFGYVPWETSKTSDTIAGHWAEYQAGVAGDAIFPAYTLEALAGKDAQGADTWVPLVDGYQTTEEQLTFRLHDPAGVDDLRMWVYRGTSATPARPPGDKVTIDLQDGANPIGVLEEGLGMTP